MAISIQAAVAHDERWLSFVRANPDLTLFQSPRWCSVIEKTYGFATNVLLALEGDAVLGGMPFAHIEDFRGARRVAFPFADNVEPLPDSLWPAFETWIAADAVPWTIRSRVQPTQLAAQFKEAATHHVLALPATVEETQALYHFKHVQNLKQAAKAGLTHRRLHGLDGVDAFYQLHSNVRKTKHGLLPQPYAFFRHIYDEFFPEDGFVLVAEHERRIVSAMLFIGCGSTLYYKFSASALDALLVRPNHFLITKAIEEGIALGFKQVDLGISDTEGLIRFKERIGGTASPVFSASYNPVEKTDATRQVEKALGELTSILTDAELPLAAAQRGGDVLYRFFT
jgi:CelD/BcsL family acetyltransferase involved in cellulose biosynthesis